MVAFQHLTNPVNVCYQDQTTLQPVEVTQATPLPVTISSGSTDQDVNLVGINGAAPVTGSGTATGALRVELPTNGTGQVTATGKGTAGAADTGVQTVQGIAAAVPVGIARSPVGTAALGIVPVVSTALETGHVIKASAGNLYGLNVTTTTAGGYVQIFNSTTVPAAGAVTPIKSYAIPAASTLVIGFDPPMQCSTGISVAFSIATTPFTKTDSATAFISADAV